MRRVDDVVNRYDAGVPEPSRRGRSKAVQEVDPLPPHDARKDELLQSHPAEAVSSRAERENAHPLTKLGYPDLAPFRSDERDELPVRQRGRERRNQPPRVRLHPARLARNEEEQVQPDPSQRPGHRRRIMTGGAATPPR